MEFNNINFDNLQSIKKKCITFAKDGNTVIKPYKMLYCVQQMTHNAEHTTLYAEVLLEDDFNMRLWDDYGKVAYSIGRINKSCTLEKFTEQVKAYGIGQVAFLKRLKYAEEAGYYINMVDIETVLLIGEKELATHYIDYREELIKKREEERLKEAADAEAKEKAEEERHIEEINKQIEDAEYKIFHQKNMENTDIEGTTVVNLLMRKHGIKVPLRTQGWINSKLSAITFSEKGISYRFYGKTQKDNSTVFIKYLRVLETSINQALSLSC